MRGRLGSEWTLSPFVLAGIWPSEFELTTRADTDYGLQDVGSSGEGDSPLVGMINNFSKER